ncbi:glycosyltransferase [Xanthobacter versatilis]|uniref:glycosyltransferase n=1 Tax=Xanthobacter autotrophicus (strain ATCC BAA-1158 / Py2) TaxID=78245 RepID=UPI0037271E3A
MRAKRVLLAWEQGAGFGHTTQLSRLGRRLMAAGNEVVAAVRYPQLSAPLAEAGIRVIQSPIWPPPPQRPEDAVPASATLSDSLGRAGLRDPASVRMALRGWRAILDAEQPDLMVCDYAPLAAPAAQGRCAIMQAGTAYCLPPADLEQMPVLHEIAPPVHRDADLLASVNSALADEGMAPLPRIGALFAGDDVFVRTFPLIDPYADLRERQAEGPILGAAFTRMRPGARGIFAYLHVQVASRPDVMEALRALGPELEIHIPGAAEGLTEPLRTAGVHVHAKPAPMAEVLSRSRLVLHQGSAGIATEALLAGVPQVTLSVHGEHYLNGECLAAAGLSHNVPLFDPRVRVAVETIRAMHADEEALLMAEAAGRMHRAMLDEDPLDVLTRRCLALL